MSSGGRQRAFGHMRRERLRGSRHFAMNEITQLHTDPQGAKAQRPKRKCVLVLGMHRSGTSALTRVVNLLGCDLPKTLMAAGAANEMGHWESTAIFGFNDRVLESAGSNWYDWQPVNPAWFQSPRAEQFAGEALSVLKDEFGASHLFVLKDPRICRFAPFWLDVLERAGVQPLILIPLRNPLEVAASLSARDGFDPSFGHLLWLRHVLDAEAATRGRPRHFSTYDQVMTGWAKLAMGAQSAFGMGWPRLSDTVATEIDAFLSNRYRHHREAPEGVVENPMLSSWLRDSFDIFTTWAQSGEKEADYPRLDRIRAEFNGAAPAFSRVVAAGRIAVEKAVLLERSQKETAARLAEVESTAQGYQADARAALSRAEAAEQGIVALTARIGDLDRELRASRNDVQAVLAQAAATKQEAETQLAEVRTRAADLHRELTTSLAAADEELGKARMAGRDTLSDLAQRLRTTHAALDLERAQVSRLETDSSAADAALALVTGAYATTSIPAMARRVKRQKRLEAWRATPDRITALIGEIARNRMFHAAWYRRRYLGGRRGVHPWMHFLTVGLRRDLSPHPLFDPRWYRARRGPGMPPRTPAIVDFLATALTVKASPHPLFDVGYYLARMPHILATRQNPLGHYLTEGYRLGVSPSPMFDIVWFRSQFSDPLGTERDPLVHFLEAGQPLRAMPHPLFHTNLYLAENADVAASGMAALVHYATSGGQEARRPHALFDNAWYRATYPLESDGWRTPLAHYLIDGERSGFWPNPLFDPLWYFKRYGHRLAPGQGALEHYLAQGRREGCWPNPLFDIEWYLDTNPDVAASGVDPLEHYLGHGERESRFPNAHFDPTWYRAENSDVVADDMSALRHYLVAGQFEGRKPSANFDAGDYLASHPGAVADGQGALAFCLEAERQARRARAASEGLAGIDGSGSASPVARATETQPAGRRLVPHQVVPPAMSLPAVDGVWEWRDYAGIKAQRGAAQRRRIERLSTRTIDMVRVDRQDLAEAAARLAFPAVDRPLVSILIPVFNHVTLTLECLTTIERHTRDVSYEIIVADDASTDETAEIIASLANVCHVRQPENLNFLRNCNAAAKRARGRYLVILNNDAQVTPGWLTALVAAFESSQNVGAVGPKFVYPNGRLQEAGASLNPDGTSKMIGLFDDPDLPRFNYRREVDYCSGACLMVETTRFHEMGGFAEAFAPAYSEDSELCLRLRQAGLKILYEPASTVVHHLSKTTAAIDESFKMRAAAVNQQKLVTRWQETIDRLNDVRLLAFYLPQFHPIPENDRWWGTGFTEWRNVSKAFPNYVGHYQPRRPAELGYYDLRLPDVMEAQAALARRYGVTGFCYYYYWFAGQRLLERPLEQLLASGRPDLPFCLCWANENWTRRWDGENQNILIGQKHSPEDDIAVIADLGRYFRAPNYIRVGGRPLLLVYRVKLFPDFSATVERWRRYCRENGIGEIYVATVEAFDQVGNLESPERWGCDAGVEFPPHGFGNARKPTSQILNPRFEGITDDYVELVHRYLDRPVPGYRRFRGVMAGWDNTPRRQNNSLVFENATPGAFQAWLEAAIAETREQAHGDERIVFINAWNEWAEGAYLEPDMRFGHTWLEAVRNARDAQLMTKG